MPTTPSTVDFLVEQLGSSGAIRSRKMFGEYAIYCDNKVVALVCDDQLYIKKAPTPTIFLDATHDAAPFPGAKMYHKVPAERWEDGEWLSEFIRETAAVLPLPKPKSPKKSKRGSTS